MKTKLNLVGVCKHKGIIYEAQNPRILAKLRPEMAVDLKWQHQVYN
jgi:hypothetical protein